MLFNSTAFAFFLFFTFLLYWKVFNRQLRLQNIFLLGTSYFFYGCWDWRFLILIVISSFVDYFAGLKMYSLSNEKHTSGLLNKKQFWLGLSLTINLGMLLFFKYFNFFIESFIELFAWFGISLNANPLHIILPVGISFYTFQTLSYTIDIYRGKLKPVNDIIAFFSFVSFFPQLVAGPIERAEKLLPQFTNKRFFNLEDSKDGMRQILWGLFIKVVIADNVGINVDYIFSNYQELSGGILLTGAIFFAFQIYCDFAGYSSIAIGTAKLFGFRLMTNFQTPYFSRDIGEFWRRWHISLSTWFRDYVYIPLGGNRGSNFFQIRNSLITFSVSGLWHGANMTFVIWGVLHGLYYIPSIIFGKSKNTQIVAFNSFLPNFLQIYQMLTTFLMVCLAWVFFRAASVKEAFSFLYIIASDAFFSNPIQKVEGINREAFFWIILLIIIEWLQRKKQHTLEISNLSPYLRGLIYLLLALCIILFGFEDSDNFIYFQF